MLKKIILVCSAAVFVAVLMMAGCKEASSFLPGKDPAPGTVFKAVKKISGVPQRTVAGAALTLTGRVQPEDASYKTIYWSIKDAGTTGATIDYFPMHEAAARMSSLPPPETILNTTAPGLVTITGTIAHGKDGNAPYTQDFEIDVMIVGNPSEWEASGDSTFSGGAVHSLAYGAGKFVAAGALGNAGHIAYSYDSKSWLAVEENPFGASAVNVVVYGGYPGDGRFLAAGMNGKMAYSLNGIDWTAVESDVFGGEAVYAAAYGGAMFLAASVKGDTASSLYGVDGIEWTLRGRIIDSAAFPVSGIAYGNGRFVAVGSGGKIAYTTDCETWTLVSGAASQYSAVDFRGVAYGSGKFVAVGTGAYIAYSEDGANWTVEQHTELFNASYFVNAVAYGGGMFAVVSADGKAAYSIDGVAWDGVADTKFGVASINTITYGASRFLAAGYAGKIICSVVQ